MTETAANSGRAPGRAGPVSGMIVVSSALVLGALPLFMVGGLAVQIKDEFGFSEAALGAAVTIGFVLGAISAPFGGRLADLVGPRTTLYLGSSMSVIALAGLGLLTSGWGVMVVFLCLAGLALAITDPGLAILVSRAMPAGRQGLAFGIKEASIPAAALAAGLAVPAVALTVGWRWAFAIGLAPWAVIVFLLPRIDTDRRAPAIEDTDTARAPATPPHRRALALAAAAAALGTAAASGVGIFLTNSAVAMGLSPGNAGLLLATGSVAGMVARVGTGVMADRSGGPQFKLIAIMLAVGSITMALGGSGNTALLILGTIGAFTGGWAWTGIFFLSLVKTSPHRPGAVAGIGTAGLGVGNAAGPLLFGVVAQTFSFGAAWLAAAIISGVAALVMATARRRF
ncbi:MAG: MFS transporter [Acidimicrobiia bacterium]